MAWTYYTSRQHHRRKKPESICVNTPEKQQQRHRQQEHQQQQSHCYNRFTNCLRLNNLFVAVYICSILFLKCSSGGINAQVCNFGVVVVVVVIFYYNNFYWMATTHHGIKPATNRHYNSLSHQFIMFILLKRTRTNAHIFVYVNNASEERNKTWLLFDEIMRSLKYIAVEWTTLFCLRYRAHTHTNKQNKMKNTWTNKHCENDMRERDDRVGGRTVSEWVN